LALSVNYPTPVWVNGFQCRNCTDVDLAKQHIDPAHPKSGPFNVDASTDPTRLLQDQLNPPGSRPQGVDFARPGVQLDLIV
jgi:hypothetical protein